MVSSDSLTLRFRPSVDDYTRSGREAYRHRTASLLRRVVGPASILGFSYMAGVLVVRATGPSAAPLWANWGILALLGWAGAVIGRRIQWRLAARKTVKHFGGPEAMVEYRMSEAGIDLKMPFTTMHNDWESFERAVETDRFFLLYFDAVGALFVPEHALAGTQQEESLRSLLTAKVGLTKQ